MDKSKGVFVSLRTFSSLRTALAYLRSTSAIFQSDGTERRSEVAEEIRWMLGNGTDTESDELRSCYQMATMAVHVALTYATVLHYRKLGQINSDLRHEELDRLLADAERGGLLESMRQVRNSVFHVRPKQDVWDSMKAVLTWNESGEPPWQVWELFLYDFTEQMFSETEIFQESREVLVENFNKALEYYNDHIAENQDIDHKPNTQT